MSEVRRSDKREVDHYANYLREHGFKAAKKGIRVTARDSRHSNVRGDSNGVPMIFNCGINIKLAQTLSPVDSDTSSVRGLDVNAGMNCPDCAQPLQPFEGGDHYYECVNPGCRDAQEGVLFDISGNGAGESQDDMGNSGPIEDFSPSASGAHLQTASTKTKFKRVV